MTRIIYTYSVVRYVHDPAASETLNVGVLLYAPSARYFGFRLESKYKRLSEAFAGFDGEQYRRTLRQLELALEKLWDGLAGGLPGMFDLPDDAGSLATHVWPDQGLSFRFGPTLAGVTDAPEAALEALFARMVASQYERPITENQTDEEVWARYARPFAPEVKRILQEKVLETTDYELKFPHAFKNGQWHLIQPVTLDYAQSTNIQDKAARWLGRATLLNDSPEVATLYLLLGAPHKEELQKAYARARNILHKIPIKHQIIEENEASDFARWLQGYMEEHGLLERAGRGSVARAEATLVQPP